MSPFQAACLLGSLCLLVTLLSEWRGWRRGVLLFKPLTSSCFIWAGFAAGAIETSLGQALLCALCLSWTGDVLLMARDSEVLFKVGVLSFLLGHIALIVTFMIGGVDPIWCVLASPFVLFTAQRVYHWLAPHVTGSMRSAVSAYILVISSMLIIAIGTLGADQPWERLFGASAFFVSDLAVARQRFITPTIVNRLWGLPLYYVAQFTLAGSLTLA